MDALTTPQARRAIYGRLLLRYDTLLPAADAETRWLLLMAAHVAGQENFALHLHSHWRMLGLAWQQRDAGEVAGQLLRLALTPIGHGLGRLPTGNVGRATVPALRPMVPPPAVLALIAQAARG